MLLIYARIKSEAASLVLDRSYSHIEAIRSLWLVDLAYADERNQPQE